MKKSLLLVVLLVAVAIVFIAPDAVAQGCSLCTKTASQLGDKGARGLNGGILYLATIPVCILGGIGFCWWKYYRND